MVRSYSVDVFRCEESGVLVGTSEDIPGLTLEAETLGALLEAIMEMAPQLIAHNIGLPEDAEVQVAIRGAGSGQRLPRYVVEELPIAAHA